ncbi:MAG: hypothetical protein ACYS1A_20120 [Planctomycetota bacterium]
MIKIKGVLKTGLGLVDEYYIFKRALEANEITELMDGNFGPFLAVRPGGKLTTTWSTLRNGYEITSAFE